jgi:hypothetical protein
MSMWSNAWVYVCLLAGISGSNYAKYMDACLLGVLCVVRQRFLLGLITRSEDSYRVLCVSATEEPHRGVLGPLWS